MLDLIKSIQMRYYIFLKVKLEILPLCSSEITFQNNKLQINTKSSSTIIQIYNYLVKRYLINNATLK